MMNPASVNSQIPQDPYLNPTFLSDQLAGDEEVSASSLPNTPLEPTNSRKDKVRLSQDAQQALHSRGLLIVASMSKSSNGGHHRDSNRKGHGSLGRERGNALSVFGSSSVHRAHRALEAAAPGAHSAIPTSVANQKVSWRGQGESARIIPHHQPVSAVSARAAQTQGPATIYEVLTNAKGSGFPIYAMSNRGYISTGQALIA